MARRAVNPHGCVPASLCPPFFLLRGYPGSAKLVLGRPPPAAAPPVPRFRVRGSAGGQVCRRHTEMCGCRCFLPDLTGFADFRCGGPGRRRTRGVPPADRVS